MSFDFLVSRLARSRIRNRRVVEKLQRAVKVSDIHSGFRVVRLIYLNLTLAHFRMREVRACESPVSLGAWRRTINVHCHVVRDPFSNLYMQFVYEFRISAASLPIESNLCFSRQFSSFAFRLFTFEYGQTRRELASN